MPFGVYVHVPFCAARCDYCDFATWTDRGHLIESYVEACVEHGYEGPWGVEVLSDELRNNPIDVIFRRAYEATAAQF